MSLIIPVDDRLMLRLVEPEHAEAIFDAMRSSLEHIGRWMPWVAATRSADDTRAFCERALREFAERKQLAVAVLEDGRVVGGTGWTDWVTHDPAKMGVSGSSADIGYWLIASAVGRGIMTRCVHKLLDVAFTKYGMHRITIRAEPGNERSNALPRRLGFTHEGTLRHVCRWNGRWVDHELYSMLDEQWRARPAQTVGKQTPA
jgi:ribosomal-protein-serine acetyltransferase